MDRARATAHGAQLRFRQKSPAIMHFWSLADSQTWQCEPQKAKRSNVLSETPAKRMAFMVVALRGCQPECRNSKYAEKAGIVSGKNSLILDALSELRPFVSCV